MAVNITINEKVSAKLKRVSRVNVLPAMTKIGEFVRHEAVDNIQAKGRLMGGRWKARSPRYKKAVKRKYGRLHPVMILTGRLKGNFRKKIPKQHEVVIFNPTPYFKYHQLGAPSINLPKRPMLVVNANIEKFALKQIENAVNRELIK